MIQWGKERHRKGWSTLMLFQHGWSRKGKSQRASWQSTTPSTENPFPTQSMALDLILVSIIQQSISHIEMDMPVLTRKTANPRFWLVYEDFQPLYSRFQRGRANQLFCSAKEVRAEWQKDELTSLLFLLLCPITGWERDKTCKCC